MLIFHHIEHAVGDAGVYVVGAGDGVDLPEGEVVGVEVAQRRFEVAAGGAGVAGGGFGHHEDLVPVLRHQELAEVAFAAAALVLLRRVEEPDAAFERGFDGGLGIVLAHPPDMPAAAAEHRDRLARATEPPPGQHVAEAVVGCLRGGVAGGWGQEARRECREGFEKRASIHDRGFFINLELNVPANGQTVACTAPAY